ncbi:MAG: oligosaccharide flippase family protein [Bacteroidales bacterium]|nr:oligosaccharide flippase family protein [Bacteroidales bacterium]
MGNIKQLASQTFIYGLSSIVGRLLNYLLVPFYTRVFEKSEYGTVTEMYTYVTFLMIFLTYGMETGFFKFSKTEQDKDKLYSTSFISLLITSSIFIAFGLFFAPNIANLLNYQDHVYYISFFIIILGVDALTSIPFARLRQLNKPIKFAVYKLVNICTNIFFNLFFILWLPSLAEKFEFFNSIYDPSIRVGYIFLSNLIASVVSLVMFLPDFFKIKINFSPTLLKSMLLYSLPLLVSGLAGQINEFFDRISINCFLTVPEGVADPNQFKLSVLGIYGANAKIAVFMTLFIQCFRYAADPFFFSNQGQSNFNELFANVNKYLLAFGLFIFLFIIYYLDFFKYFIGPEFWDGLKVVPMLLFGHLLVGLIYIQSFWYKLKFLTKYGIIIFVIGSIITIILNVVLVPIWGYMACAFANNVCYLTMLLITFFWGRKHLPCKYDFKSMILYFILAIVLYIPTFFTTELSLTLRVTIHTVLLFIFVLVVFKNENLSVELKKLISKFIKTKK